MVHPAWKDMTDQQKLEFLHEWCENLSHTVQRQDATIEGLLVRLQAVEAKASGTS